MDRLASDARSALGAIRRRQGPDLLAVGLVFAVYTLTLWGARQSSLFDAMAAGVANTIPVVIFGAIARRVIVTRLIGKSVWVQVVGHAALCIAFSLCSYWLLIVLLGMRYSPSPLNFVVKSFITSGMAWALLENVTIYGLLASLSYARAPRLAPNVAAVVQAAAPLSQKEPSHKEPSRYLVRIGDELRPIDLDRIVSIAGADDYAELSTLDGKRLVAMTLAEFEATLDPARFVRVHRSRIVNLDYVERAEPAGAGRLLLHMRTGEMVSTSRTGSRLLKSRVI